MVDGFGKVETTDSGRFFDVETNAGDALVFSSFLVHESGVNESDRIRWSCHFRFNDLDDPSFIRRGYPTPYTYAPQPDLITPNFPCLDDLRRTFNG
jgi:ectoine hydroxylase-related dioxygenase (phytanoyl-CoA dioxygenase family)